MPLPTVCPIRAATSAMLAQLDTGGRSGTSDLSISRIAESSQCREAVRTPSDGSRPRQRSLDPQTVGEVDSTLTRPRAAAGLGQGEQGPGPPHRAVHQVQLVAVPDQRIACSWQQIAVVSQQDGGVAEIVEQAVLQVQMQELTGTHSTPRGASARTVRTRTSFASLFVRIAVSALTGCANGQSSTVCLPAC